MDMGIVKYQTTGPRNQSSFTRFQEMIVFSILFNGLESLKPLVIKLQKRNSDVYQSYPMIHDLIYFTSRVASTSDTSATQM